MEGHGNGQAICDNSGWMGGYRENTKKWTKPKEKPQHKDGEAWKETEEWLGGVPAGYSPRHNAKAPIKIDGLRSSIKENPFLKNDH